MSTNQPTLFLALGLLGCAGSSSTITYGGRLSAQAGVCDPTTQAELTIRGGSVLFAPASGTVLLRGNVASSAISATATLIGADKKPYEVRLLATLNGQSINGTYSTPRCSYHLQLRRTAD